MIHSVGPGVVFLLGPTASGKTGLAVALAEHLGGEIVSVDSAMVYRGLDIGAAKPDAATLARSPHALIDIRDPAAAYSAADFARDARREIERIHRAGRLPILVGGTSLYFRALEYGLSAMPARDAAVRQRLTAEAEQCGWQALHARLAAIDATSAARIHPNDSQRIQRALELYTLTGEPPSALYARANESPVPWSLCKLAIAPATRRLLHERIESRFDGMMASGFYPEVEKLYARPDLDMHLPAMRAVGYRQLCQVIDGRLSTEQGRRNTVVASRQLAKRQLTWLRSLNELAWFDSDTPRLVQQVREHVRRWRDSL